jgi:NAD(P)-dependent dehydrogenase (short-subunit alcohol dehydrogenase family)
MSDPAPVQPDKASRVALVTGASQGIGAACAVALSADGYRVALVARNAEGLKEVATELPGESLVLPTDVLDPAALDEAFATTEETWGPVDVLVVNAGAAMSAPLTKTSDEDWQRMLDLNLTAPFRCLRRALPAMTATRWGRVVVIASIAGKHGSARIAAYTASKHGVLGLVRTAAAEVARTGVTVNAVCPGYVDTPMTDESVANISAGTGRSAEEARELLANLQPIGRLVTPTEVASAVMLCVDNGAINGQGLNVDGGAVQS